MDFLNSVLNQGGIAGLAIAGFLVISITILVLVITAIKLGWFKKITKARNNGLSKTSYDSSTSIVRMLKDSGTSPSGLLKRFDELEQSIEEIKSLAKRNDERHSPKDEDEVPKWYVRQSLYENSDKQLDLLGIIVHVITEISKDIDKIRDKQIGKQS